MNRPVLFKGVDVAIPLTYTQCEALKNARYKFVCRYYSNYSKPLHRWKMLSKDEAKLISNSGLDIVSVYETEGFYFKTYSQKTGEEDCINAIKCAKMIGQPINTTIYFAVEPEVDNAVRMNNIYEYFLGISEEMKKFKEMYNSFGWHIGVYGCHDVVKNIYNKYEILDCWQTSARSDNKIFDKAHLFQHKFRVSTWNVGIVDENLAYSTSFGQFRV
ncbi:DUF1906 domain-containing protein [Clostridium lundense]|uniref:DUF1906 domain-containing protein n=1 Tax=Clostridium lundense TaxID=319475 RepID=UPI00047FA081|nr:DUF1906 domain-containing protein [Clostridium lundense]